tara:strand:- start:21024 stop:25397 length:4374 start_codon:yes stop_codon:yes gene_type:complete
MKKMLAILILGLVPLYVSGQVIDSFDSAPADTSYWQHERSQAAADSLSFVNPTYVTDPLYEGAGAMQLDYSAHNSESWGGYAKIYHMAITPSEPEPVLSGTWRMAPIAGAMMVGPAPNDGSWWSNSEEDLTTRACYFDDNYVFGSDGSFSNILGDETWVEGWQGGADACGAPVYPHDGSNAATFDFNSGAGTLTLNGVGAYLGLPKAWNGGELGSPDEAPESITYDVTLSGSNMTLVIETGTGVFWTFQLVADTPEEPEPALAGTWKMAPEAGAMMVGPNPNDGSWWQNSAGDVEGRACYFDDDYVFGADGSFSNVLGDETWVEGWQGGGDACGAPVAPHDGSNAATWAYDPTTGNVTLSGEGAYLGLPKANNEGELPNVPVPESITYSATLSDNNNVMTLVIECGSGVFWTFKLVSEDRSQALANSWDGRFDASVLMDDLGAPSTREGVWDWTGYESISFSYYNLAAQTLAERVHLRLNLSDFKDISDPSSYTGLGEYYYSFHYILDSDPGWNTITIPLLRNDSWDGGGFNLTGWAGDAGNGELDIDAIGGFHLEFSISGGGDGDYSSGTIVLDDFRLTGTLNALNNPGFETADESGDDFGWGTDHAGDGQAHAEVVNDSEMAYSGSSYARLGTDNGAAWAVFFSEDIVPAQFGETWRLSGYAKSLSPVDGDFGAFKLEGKDADGNVLGTTGDVFLPITEEWGLHSIEFVMPEGVTQVTAVIVASRWDGANCDYAFDDIFLLSMGVLDVIPPVPVENVSAIPAGFYNLVTWSDINGEEGETYNVYASTQPITDVTSPSVDVIATNVLEGSQAAVHYLYNPLEDEVVSYYYAVACKDASNNVGEPGGSASSVTNTALGIPTISLDAPANFVADGEFDEWYDSGITPFFLGASDNSWGTPSIVGSVDSDDDLSGQIWLAVDEDYLYVAADVIDDVYDGYQPGDGTGGWWENDVFELFIGFYDQRGPKHVGMMRGEEPDYKFFFLETGVINDFDGQAVLEVNGEGNYYQEGFNPDYVLEARISLDDIAFGDDLRLNAVNGMRIPIEPTFHDNDGNGWEGNLVGSPTNADNAWQTPTVWSSTWIGDQTAPSGGEVTTDISTAAGWNLVGLPSSAESSSYSDLFPTAVSGTLYGFDGTYTSETDLTPGDGYWLNFPEEGTTTITGSEISSVTVSLSAGWNLISGVSYSTSVSSISDPGDIVVPGTVYGFSGTYANSSELAPGQGYWINASGDGDIIITSGGAARTAQVFTDRTEKANKLIFNNSALYFGVSIPEDEMLSYQLPPKPPAGSFDVRFADNMKVAEGEGVIEVMNNTDDLAISFVVNIDAGERMRWVLTSNDGKEYELNGSGQIVVEGNVSGFSLSRVSSVPMKFAISQNFPNPFNPVTSINYEIPEESFVTISVYNMMGQKVTDLVYGFHSPGYHRTEWDGTNINGETVSSGLYIYTINAGDFRDVKKMISIK